MSRQLRFASLTRKAPQCGPTIGNGSAWGMPNCSPSWRNRSSIPASCRPSAVKGGDFTSPRSQISGLVLDCPSPTSLSLAIAHLIFNSKASKYGCILYRIRYNVKSSHGLFGLPPGLTVSIPPRMRLSKCSSVGLTGINLESRGVFGFFKRRADLPRRFKRSFSSQFALT